MPIEVHECECEACRQSKDHPNLQVHHQMNVFLSRLDEQQRRWYFEYIDQAKSVFLAVGDPVISVDSKKKELIGNFKNNGREWCQQATAVMEPD